MHGIYRFCKSTIIGGLVVLVPLIVVVAVAAWAFDAARKVLVSLFEWLPDQSVAGVSLTMALAGLGVVLLCFLAGLYAESAILRRLSERAERLALSIPGYALMKNVGVSFVGIEEKAPTKTVLVRFEASWQLGFLMETLADGRGVVFIPGVPRALVGTLHLVAPDRLQVLDIPVATTLDILGRLGIGLGEHSWKSDPSSGPAP